MHLKHFTIGIIILLAANLSACQTSSSPAINTSPTQSDPPITVTPQQLSAAASTNVTLGLYYLEQHNIPDAKAKLLLALKQNPHDAIAHDAMGYFLEKTGEIAAAESYYHQAIALAPAQGATHNNYGTFLYRQHRCTEAFAEFNTALRDKNYLNLAAIYKNIDFATRCSMQP